MLVGTVINKAWLAHARALAESLAANQPDARLSVLVVDPLDGCFDPAEEPFEVLSPDDVEIPGFEAMSARYDITELCCALKPAILRHLLARDATALYLDSDVRVYAPLDGLEEAFGDGDLVLTPHLLAPLPDDGLEPSDRAIVLAGLFNLGFAAARPGPDTDRLLDWWGERLQTGSRAQPELGLVYDQRWAELLPGLSGRVSLWRDPGVNWGYWRAPTAPLSRGEGGLLAGGSRLRTLHFTGLDLNRPELLSGFDNRTSATSDPVLGALRADFVARLLEHGHEQSSRWPYGYGQTSGGVRLDATLRRLWDLAYSERAVTETPFSPSGEAAFVRWLGESEPGRPGRPVSRYLTALRDADASLRARFPDPTGADHDDFHDWAREKAENEPDSMIAALLHDAGTAAAPGLTRLAPGERIPADRDGTAVCIPVYGAVDMLGECLGAVLAHTDPRVPVVVADDASPDPGVLSLLEELDAAGRFSEHTVYYLRQPKNLGFPGNVNSVFEAAAPADVVVLNSDCVVAAGWLTGLERAARSDALVATASALTNNGTILSVPYRNSPQAGLPQDKTLAAAAANLMRTSLRLYPRLPTAVGHCMLIRRRALDLVGPFDLAFSPGYGEEVDFSQRCALHGLTHVAADDVLVLHHGSASLGSDGAANPVQIEHERILDSRYPYYQRAQAAAGNATDTPLARSLSTARRALVGMTATIDARCLGPIVTGTQVHTLEVIRAISQTGRVATRVIVPPDLGAHAGEQLAGMANVSLIAHTEVGGKSDRTDVSHRPYQVSSAEDLELLAAAGQRLVITHQDLIAYGNPGYFPGFPQWQRYQRLTRQTLAIADRVVFFSAHAAADAMREDLIDGDRAKVVYIGVDHHSAPPAPVPPDGCESLGEAPMLLCLGTDFRHKNRVFALRLLEELRANEAWEGKLVLAGPSVGFGSSGPEEARYLAAHPTLAEHVITLPAIDEAEKTWLLDRCAAVLYPTTFEGFGLMPFEAAASDRPCLFASHTALAETLPSELATLVPWDARLSASRVAGLLRDERRCAEHVRETRRAGTRFSWKSTGEQLVDVYYEAASSPARDATRVAIELATADAEREDDKRKYTELWESLSPNARALIAPDGPLTSSQQAALAAMARRPLTRRLLFGPLLLAHRLLGGSRGEPEASRVAPEQAEVFALHVAPLNREHMRDQLAGDEAPAPQESARDWLPEVDEGA
ncbi:MAG TPA: glycosyltransferase [Solirubrobacteraceae bacterium]|nr:glycosyltransferase [Solirubrobacteraceae bacterium]